MALKRKLTEEDYNKLSKDLKEYYKKADGGDEYILETEGDEDTGALKRAKDHEKGLRQKAEKELRELKEAQTTLQEELDALKAGNEDTKKGKKGDTDAVEAAWKAKHEKEVKKLTDQITALQDKMKASAVEAAATKMAAELAGDNAELILPHIQRRLQAELTEGVVNLKVMGSDGQVSALTPAELQKEFLSNEKFSTIVVGSKASGGGAAGARKGGGAAKKKLSEMTATEEAQFANSDPAGYAAQLKAEQAST